MSTSTPAVGTLLSFEVIDHVTLPILDQPKDGSPFFILIKTAIAQAQELESEWRRRRSRTPEQAEADKTAAPQAPPDICEVRNLADNRPYQLIVNAVMRSSLERKYPDNGYIGRCFQMRRLEMKKAGSGQGSYWKYEILEIKLKTAEPAADAQSAQTSSAQKRK